MPDIADRSVGRYDVTCHGIVAVHPQQLFVTFEVIGVGQHELFALFTWAASLLVGLDRRVVVPVDLGAQHIMFLFEERVGWLEVFEVFDRLHWQHHWPAFKVFSLCLKFLKSCTAAAGDAVLRGMFVQLCD